MDSQPGIAVTIVFNIHLARGSGCDRIVVGETKLFSPQGNGEEKCQDQGR